MNRRKPLHALALMGAVATIVAFSASPASAAQRTFVVTLLGGGQVTVTLDVPEGTPVDQITFPGLDLPVVSVQEVTPAPTATAPPASSTPTPGQTSTPGAPPAESGAPPQGAPGSDGHQQSGQQTQQRHQSGDGSGSVQDLATAIENEGAQRERRNPD